MKPQIKIKENHLRSSGEKRQRKILYGNLSDTSHSTATVVGHPYRPPPYSRPNVFTQSFLYIFPFLAIYVRDGVPFHPLRNSMDGYSPSALYDWPSSPDTKATLDLFDVYVCARVFVRATLFLFCPVVFAKKKCTVIDSHPKCLLKFRTHFEARKYIGSIDTVRYVCMCTKEKERRNKKMDEGIFLFLIQSLGGC